MSMTVDCSDFEKGFKKIVKKCPEEGAKGIFDALNQLLIDANEEQPYTPYDEGILKGSGKVDKVEIKKNEISGVAGFNKEYAARWHELTPEEDSKINWTLPGSGRKYLESKMAMFKEKYMKIVALSIQLALKRGR